MIPLIAVLAERHNYTPAEMAEMTPYQAMILCADPEYLRKLAKWRAMTPKVRRLMEKLEGFKLGS